MASSNLSIAREIAYGAFVKVMEAREKPEDAFENILQSFNKEVKRVDKNLAKEILFGGLRWYSKIFWILQNTSNRDLNKVTPEIRSALVLGTYQIFYLDRVPDRAAVNESVEYIRKVGQQNACSFVNGILRQIARRAEYFQKPDKVVHPLDYLSLQYAHPKWLVARWLRHFKFERLENMLSVNNQPPPWSVRVNFIKTKMDDVHLLQQQLLRNEKTHSERSSLRTCLHLKETPNLDPGSIFNQGYYTIQDEAAQLIGLLVAPQPNEVIIDACCAPGGKLSHLYELSEGRIKLYAVDKQPHRMKKAHDTMERLGHSDPNCLTWVQEDYLTWNPGFKADKILLDAPCTGLGILRRHPEGKWHKEESNIRTMAEQQKELIKQSFKNLKAGGELVYSVCSFEPEETIEHIRWIRNTYGDKVELVSPINRLTDYFKKYVTRDNLLLIYAGNQDDMDGFGAFIFRVKSDLE